MGGWANGQLDQLIGLVNEKMSLLTGALKENTDELKRFNATSTRLSFVMIALTVAILVLTVIMVFKS